MEGLDESAIAGAMVEAVNGTHGLAPGSLTPELVAVLLDAIAGAQFEPLDPRPGGGPVTQVGSKLEVPRCQGFCPYWGLARAMGQMATGLPGDDGSFDPNSSLVQRYGPSEVGVSPHRDSAQFRSLIVIATIEGAATFSLHQDRDAPPVRTFVVAAGDVCVLPAAGPSRPQHSLPFHAVSGALDRRRTSVTFRERSEPGTS